MLLGETLLEKNLVTKEDIERALEHQKATGARLGDVLVEMGLLTKQQVNDVLYEAPQAPLKISDTGLDAAFLQAHLLKGMLMENLATPGQMADAIKLPSLIVNKLLQDAVDRKIVIAAGAGGALTEMRYELTEAGRKLATEAMEQNQYFGPAPVTLEAYRNRINRQRITNELITKAEIDKAFSDIVVPESFIRSLGPAINSGTSILIYGPAGNGKTTVAEKVAAIFENVVYVPYCFEVDGNIVKVFDPAVHKEAERPSEEEVQTARPTLRRDKADRRWVACRRPVVITGGELNLEMLDLKFNSLAKFYEAPLHVKALNGTFIIDDFGRQLIKPEDLLNRWIVPLQSRIDYLTLHTGKSFFVPFDEMVIFSTNLSPNNLMDPAFLRRIPYKLETVAPPKEIFKDVFFGIAKKSGLALSEEMFEYIHDELIHTAKKDLAFYQPKFIIDQVVNSCKYNGVALEMTKQFIDDAMGNLYVKDSSYQGLVAGRTDND